MTENGKAGISLLHVLQGALVGAFAIIPGASGGVLAVSMGLYEPCIEAVYNFFRYFRTKGKQSFLFLLPLCLGGVAGLFACSFGLEWMLAHAYEPFMFALIGLVLGGLPSFFKQANEGGFRLRYLWAAVLGFGILLAVALLQKGTESGAERTLTAGAAMFCGALVAAGTMLPGMSTSFVLMLLGLYQPMLRALTHLQWGALVWAGVGGVLGGALMLLFVRKMFRRFHGYAYYAMLGFLAATVAAIFPGFTGGLLALDAGLFAAAFAFAAWMANIDKRDPLTDGLPEGIMKSNKGDTHI